MVKGQSLQPTIEKYWNFVKSTVQGRKRLLVKGQSKISAGQDFDRGRRSPYSTYLRDTPLATNLVNGGNISWMVYLCIFKVLSFLLDDYATVFHFIKK